MPCGLCFPFRRWEIPWVQWLFSVVLWQGPFPSPSLLPSPWLDSSLPSRSQPKGCTESLRHCTFRQSHLDALSHEDICANLRKGLSQMLLCATTLLTLESLLFLNLQLLCQWSIHDLMTWLSPRSHRKNIKHACWIWLRHIFYNSFHLKQDNDIWKLSLPLKSKRVSFIVISHKMQFSSVFSLSILTGALVLSRSYVFQRAMMLEIFV